jgi:hypothetical protein
MPLAGDQLSFKEALALGKVVGFGSGPKLVTAIAVMCAESGRYVGAWHDNDNGSTDRGLFQLNTIHANITDAEAYDPKQNAAFAYELSKQGTDFSPWAAYNSGAYEKFLDDVRTVKQEKTWESRVRLWL